MRSDSEFDVYFGKSSRQWLALSGAFFWFGVERWDGRQREIASGRAGTPSGETTRAPRAG